MIGERIRTIIQAKGLKQRELASLIGVSPNYMSEIISGKKDPSDLVLNLISDRCAINLDWLTEGKGEMWAQPQERRQIRETIPPSSKKFIDAVIEILEKGDKETVAALKANIRAFLKATRSPKEKRGYSRVFLNVPVDFQITDEAEAHSGMVINASQMGLLIQSSRDMPVGRTVNLTISFPQNDGSESFRAVGEIVWKDKRRLDDSEAWQYGVKLIEVLNKGHLKLESLLRGQEEMG
jgi:transcriptional regulator with XRE-family HTH domain